MPQEASSHMEKGDRLSTIINSPAMGVVKPRRAERTNERPLWLHPIIGQEGCYRCERLALMSEGSLQPFLGKDKEFPSRLLETLELQQGELCCAKMKKPLFAF